MATDAIHPAPPAKRIWPHERIARLGTQQALLIAHGQLRQLGVGARTINRAVDRRQLHPYRHRGIYGLVETSALPPLAAEHAAVLVGGPAAMLSHLSALWLWDLLDPHDPPIAPDPVQLTVVGAETARRRPGLEMHRAGRFWRNERRRRRALPVASPALALLDWCRCCHSDGLRTPSTPRWIGGSRLGPRSNRRPPGIRTGRALDCCGRCLIRTVPARGPNRHHTSGCWPRSSPRTCRGPRPNSGSAPIALT